MTAIVLVFAIRQDPERLLRWVASLLNEPPSARAQTGSGTRTAPAFDLANLTVGRENLRAGGPPKDGIPALTEPPFMAARDAGYLQPGDRVIGFINGAEARAYPLRILNYHEIVNDVVADLPVAVTYCPLCDSVAAFDRRTTDGVREFGVSGLLYNSNVLMYDRRSKTESLWSQLGAKGVSGPGANVKLITLPIELTTWQEWQARHPETTVLSLNTGSERSYGRNPYERYFETPHLMFPASPSSDRLPTKTRVLGMWTKNAARAYPESVFGEQRTKITDVIDGEPIELQYAPEDRSIRVASAGPSVSWAYSLWFAWYAFHPDTTIFGENKASR